MNTTLIFTLEDNAFLSLEKNGSTSNLSALDLLKPTQERLKEEIHNLLSQPAAQFDTERYQYLLEQLLQLFRSKTERYAENSWQAVENAWKLFSKWCNDNNKIPLPATGELVVEYLNDVHSRLSANSLASHLWAIGAFHRATGLPDPTIYDDVKLKFSAIRLIKAQNRDYARQASAFREKHLDILIEAWRNSESLLERRDLSLLTLAYESLLRESELAAVRIGDLSFKADDSGLLSIPITKTNKSGKPEVVALSEQCMNLLCDYIELAGLSWNMHEAFLFQPLSKSGRLKKTSNKRALSGITIDRIFAKAYKLISTINPRSVRSVEPWTGHSARVGACQDLLSAGFSVLQVQKSGRWRNSLMVYRYGEGILSDEGAMAQARKGKI